MTDPVATVAKEMAHRGWRGGQGQGVTEGQSEGGEEEKGQRERGKERQTEGRTERGRDRLHIRAS